MDDRWQRRNVAAAALVVAVGLAAGGCYSPSILDCSIACGTGGDCPSGSRCGADKLCHTGALDSCMTGGGPDGSSPSDATTHPPDVPAHPPDSPTGPPDAPVHPADAPPPPPDAPPCGTTGEPDNQCPGETVGPAVEGHTITVDGRAIATVGDTDIFRVPVELQPIVTCPPSQSVSYAIQVTLTPPDATDLRLRRFNSDRACGMNTSKVGTSFCAPFTVFCAGPPTVKPVFFFAVQGNNADGVSCSPYRVSIQVCAAGSSCDNCKAL